jgi:hypothetical protein
VEKDHPLHSFRLKLNRARLHYSSLQIEIAAWFQRRPYGVFGEFEPKTSRYVFRIRMFEGVPEGWGVLIGDIVHNARSALDHLAWQLVIVGGGTPTKSTVFPILENPFAWQGGSGVGRLAGAHSEHIALVESFQPYHRADLYGWSWLGSARADPLALLAHLDNTDKHRVLIPTPVAVQSVGWTPIEVRALELETDWTMTWDHLGDGTELMAIGARKTGSDPYVRLDRRERVSVSIVPGGTLTETLDAIFERLDAVFARFLDEFR